jgi:hypothetical protein
MEKRRDALHPVGVIFIRLHGPRACEIGVDHDLTGADPALPREERFFTRFSDVTNEILEARIWAGIHYPNADVQAAELGNEVEHYIHKHLFASQ